MAISTGDKSGVTSEINVTPMIDVMLVLLIIFMIVTPLIAAGFKATLPVGTNLDSDPEKEETDVVLGIDADGNYFLNRVPISEADLDTRLKSIYATREADKVLYLKADNALKYGRVQQAVELARGAGVRVLATITEPKNTALFEDEDKKN